MSAKRAYVAERLEQIILEHHAKRPHRKGATTVRGYVCVCANPLCKTEFRASKPRKYCDYQCKRNFHESRERFSFPDYIPPAPVNIEVKRLQKAQEARLKALKLKDEIAAMKLSTSELTPEELEAIRAQERERALQGRTRVVGFNGGGPSE